MTPSRHLLFAGLLSLAACAGHAVLGDVPMLVGGSQSDMQQEAFREVHDAAGLAALQQEAFGRSVTPPAIQPDFGRERLLAVFMGRQSHGGFSLRVTGVKELADAVEVDVLFTAPAPGCPTTQMISSPYGIFALPAGPKPLRYAVERQIKYC